MGLLDRIKAKLRRPGEPGVATPVDVTGAMSARAAQQKQAAAADAQLQVRDAARVLLERGQAMQQGQGMERRGERERKVRAIVVEGDAKFAPDVSRVQGYIWPKVLAACGGDEGLAVRLVQEAMGEIVFARMHARR